MIHIFFQKFELLTRVINSTLVLTLIAITAIIDQLQRLQLTTNMHGSKRCVKWIQK